MGFADEGIQIQPGDIEVVSVASTVANGQVVSCPVRLFVVFCVWLALTVVCRSGSSSRLATMLKMCLACAVGWLTRHGIGWVSGPILVLGGLARIRRLMNYVSWYWTWGGSIFLDGITGSLGRLKG